MAENYSVFTENFIRNCFMHCLKQSDTTETEKGIQDDQEETHDSMGQDA